MDNGTKTDKTYLATHIYRYAAIVGIPVFVFGLLVNLLILYLFIFDKYFRTTSYKLISISVVSDIISTITSLAGYIEIVDRKLDYNGGTLMCRIVLCFLFTSFGVSMMNLCLIGIDRYFIVIRPLSSFYRKYKKYILIIGEIIVWLVAVAVNAPILIIVGVHHNDTLLCDIPDITLPVSIYMIIHAAIVYIIPAIVIIIIYGKMITHQKSYFQPGRVVHHQALQQQLRKKRFIQMLTWISVSYIALSWPYFATAFGMAITHQSTFMIRQKSLTYFLLSFFTVTITTSNVILNPFLYLKFDIRLRRRSFVLLQRLLPMVFNDRRSHPVIIVTSTASTGNSMGMNRNKYS